MTISVGFNNGKNLFFLRKFFYLTVVVKKPIKVNFCPSKQFSILRAAGILTSRFYHFVLSTDVTQIFQVTGKCTLTERVQASIFSLTVAEVAQSVEQRTENPRVGGSIPPLGTISHKNKISEILINFPPLSPGWRNRQTHGT